MSEPQERTDIIYSYSVVMESIDDAEDLFVIGKDRLLNVPEWNQYYPDKSICFSLFDKHEQEHKRNVHTGDLIKGTGAQNHFCMEVHHVFYDDYPDTSTETFLLELKHYGVKTDNSDSLLLYIERHNHNLKASLCRQFLATTDVTGNNISNLYQQEFWKTLLDKLLEI